MPGILEGRRNAIICAHLRCAIICACPIEAKQEPLNKGSIVNTLSELPQNVSVVIDGSNSHYIDMDVLEIIHDFKKSNASLKNINVELKNIPDFISAVALP